MATRLQQRRPIDTHRVDDDTPPSVRVWALDEPSNGCGSHLYRLAWDEGTDNQVLLHFQEGTTKIVGGRNGVSEQSLLAVLIDRLEGFQEGDFPTDDNAEALEHLRAALECQNRRHRDRVARGVYGEMKA